VGSSVVSIAAAYPVQAQVSVHNGAHPGLTADKSVKNISVTKRMLQSLLFQFAIFSTYI